jgi:hypothetical protein
MSHRSALLSTLVVLLAPPLAVPLAAQGIEYATGTMKYRISTTTKVSQSSPAGTQEFDVGIRQRYTVNLARQARDTVRETVTVDSITVSSNSQVPDMANLVGATFTGLLSPTGRVYSTTPPAVANPMLAQLSESVARFLPTYRGDLRTGATWSDTTSGKVVQQGMEVDKTTVADYTVLGDTTVAGEKAFRVKRVTKMKASGSGLAQGTPIALESSALSDARILLSPRGVYLGSTSSDDVTLKVTAMGEGQHAEYNIKQLGQTRVEAIR